MFLEFGLSALQLLQHFIAFLPGLFQFRAELFQCRVWRCRLLDGGTVSVHAGRGLGCLGSNGLGGLLLDLKFLGIGHRWERANAPKLILSEDLAAQNRVRKRVRDRFVLRALPRRPRSR